MISHWRQEFLERAPQVFKEDLKKDNQSQRMAELEQVIGRLVVQLEMAKIGFGDSDYLSRKGS